MRYFYSFLFYLFLPCILLRLLWRGRKAPAYRKRLLERFGFSPFKLQRCIWIHAVSMGETIAAIPLIKSLQARNPNVPIVVTNMTPTGSARVKSAFGDSVLNCYIPYDLPGAMARFIDRINPSQVIIMETELWPNLFAICKKRQIPVMVTNARLSAKSAKGYAKIATLTQAMLKSLHTLAAQGQADAERFMKLGMPKERTYITGNLKFDIDPPADLAAKSAALREKIGADRLLWIAASTHPGEDEIILAAHKLLCEKNNKILLILVPRHPERFNSVASLIEQQGFSLVRRSENKPCDANTAVYLGDSMGEMMLLYSVADVAFVAGSFAAIGGHNMLEPAVLKKPIITGPQLFNFADISAMLVKADAMYIVHNANELAEKINTLLLDKNSRERIGENAYKIVEKNRGSLQKQLELINLISQNN